MSSDAGVLTQYDDGVVAIGRVVEQWDDEQWSRPACGDWSGTDLAGHLVTVIGWYHSWLDCALAGDASSFMTGQSLILDGGLSAH